MPRHTNNKKGGNNVPISWVPQHVLDGHGYGDSILATTQSSSPSHLNDIWFEAYQGYAGWDIVPVFDFEYVHEFWQGVNWTPKPSELLSSATASRSVQAHPRGNVKSMFVFRTYEHTKRKPTVVEMGAPGMVLAYRYEVPKMSADDLNHEWEELRLGAIGESINATSWALQGVRLLDRTKQKNISHRFELWCSKEAEDIETYAKRRAELFGGTFTVARA